MIIGIVGYAGDGKTLLSVIYTTHLIYGNPVNTNGKIVSHLLPIILAEYSPHTALNLYPLLFSENSVQSLYAVSSMSEY